MFINIETPAPYDDSSVDKAFTITDNTTYVPSTKDDDEWEEEVIIIKRRKKAKPVVQPWNPYYIPSVGTSIPEPCMFDGLPDGVYGIACPCPRHRATC